MTLYHLLGEPENESDPDPLLRSHYLHGFQTLSNLLNLQIRLHLHDLQRCRPQGINKHKAIRISDLASTRRACVPAVGDQETRFFAALMAARQWQRDDLRGKLRLLDDKGRVLAVFTRM